jgi:tetratricopeptide (TPR) repeat protein
MKKFSSIVFLLVFLANSFHAESGNFKDNKVTTITILWDASYSSKSRNFTKEFKFLESYLQYLSAAEVEILVYSNEVVKRNKFLLSNGVSDEIITYLRNVEYDGYGVLPGSEAYSQTDRILLFSDGMSIPKSAQYTLNAPLLAINSAKEYSAPRLHNMAYFSAGYFVDLNKIEVEEGMKLIRSNAMLSGAISEIKPRSNEPLEVKGVVRSNNEPLEGAFVQIENTPMVTATDANGNYSLETMAGDVLVFSYINKVTRKITVEENGIINVSLRSKTEELDEVIVTAKATDEEEPVVTLYGNKRREEVGYSVETFKKRENDIGQSDISLLLGGKFRGVVLENGKLEKTLIRNSRTISTEVADSKFSRYALIVLDGTPLPRTRPGFTVDYSFIDPQTITSVTVLKGLAATNRFGSEGRNGVILLNSINADASMPDAPKSTPKSPTLTKYDGIPKVDLNFQQGGYGARILDENGRPDYEKYLQLRNSIGSNIDFYIETAEGFFKASEDATANRILSNVLEKYPDDTSKLRALALAYSAHGNYKDALVIYRRIKELSPSELQNRLDVAISMGKAGMHNEAIRNFKKIVSRNELALQPIRNNSIIQFKKLLANRNQSWNTHGLDKNYLVPPSFDLRVELNWSGYDSRFKFNLVKPDRKQLFWAYSEEENSIDVNESLINGVLSKQLNFVTAEKGTWYFYMDGMYSKDMEEPQYVLVEIYFNYGRINEQKHTQLIKLTSSYDGKIFAAIRVD